MQHQGEQQGTAVDHRFGGGEAHRISFSQDVHQLVSGGQGVFALHIDGYADGCEQKTSPKSEHLAEKLDGMKIDYAQPKVNAKTQNKNS